MSTPAASALLTAVQNRAAAALSGLRPQTRQAAASPLLDLLRSDVELPDITILDLPGLVERMTLDQLLDAVAAKPRARSRSGRSGLLSLDLDRLDLGNLRDFGRRLVDGNPISVVRDTLDDLRGTLGVGAVADTILGIARRQVGIGISFVTTLSNLLSPELPDRILEGWQRYFFRDTGYSTVDGIHIVAPGHAGMLAGLAPLDRELTPEGFQQSLNGLRGLLSERSAEQYVRDLIRIVVEVGGDQRFQLQARLKRLEGLVPDKAKARRWFKGAASMAESLVTSTVEEVSLGVAQFQTNPVLAAAAATYAGTAARKAAQHVFLAEATVGLP
jgi:hypothetical protein